MGVIIQENSVEDLIEAGESIEKNKKQQEYLDYINNHINAVKQAFNEFFLPLLGKDHICDKLSDEIFKDAIRKAQVNIEEHDASKFGDEEFDGYREKYYPTSKEKSDPEFESKAKERSEVAWVHHYTNNAHHPKYWHDNESGIISDMSLEYIIEMICDWKSFSVVNPNDDVHEWYNTKAVHEKEDMSDKTKEIAEYILFNFIN